MCWVWSASGRIFSMGSDILPYHQREWTLDEVQGTLDMLFEKQYILTERVVVETRYDSEGDPTPGTSAM